MVRRPVLLAVSLALACANLWSAYLRKMRPRTGTEYSDDFSFELARSSSAAPHRRLSSSVVFAGIRCSGPFFHFSGTALILPQGPPLTKLGSEYDGRNQPCAC